jgi:hypothetical protein
MTRPTLAALTIAVSLAAAGCATDTRTHVLQPEDPALAPVAWLTGAWVAGNVGEPRTEEHWIPPSGGSMIGVNRTTMEGRTVFFEYLRIERAEDGGLVYLASPKGRQPATPFRMVDSSPGRVIFENPDHDYPQRITYRRKGETRLVMRIEGEADGTFRTSEWELTRTRVRTLR